MERMTLTEYIKKIPKAELHLHIEGTFEPELMFKIADRNKIKLNFNSVDNLKAAYNFNNLQEFLDIYYTGAQVLISEEDFYDLTWAYFLKAKEDNIIHTEIMFDPQTHTHRGIPFETVIEGISKAQKDAENELGISSKLIMSFLRHLDQKSAFEIYDYFVHHKDKIHAVGLDSSEVGNPPSLFTDVFKKAKNDGLKITAHAGEEGPPEYVWEALDILTVHRIDHGNRSLEDNNLIKRIAEQQIALTVCPLSNLKLKVVDDLKKHPLKKMLDYGIKATVNSDDPAYFGGYLNDNFIQTAEAINLTKDDVLKLVQNSFEASFVSDERRAEMMNKLSDFSI